jgi:hypothetical protein
MEHGPETVAAERIGELEALGSPPLAVAAVALLLASAWGAATWLGPGLLGRRLPPLDAALLRATLGLNVLSFLGAALGPWGLLAEGRSVWLLVGLSLLPGAARLGLRNTAGAASRRLLRRTTISPSNFLAGLMVVCLAGLSLGPALCFPTGWDELVYHGVLPRRWVVAGRPAVYADLPYSGFPSGSEILFWMIAPVESLVAPRLVVWTCWMIALGLLYRLLRRMLRPAPAVALTCAFAVSPAALLISANCYVESLQLMNLAALLRTFVAWTPAGSTPADRRGIRFGGGWGWSLAAGMLAGGAAAVKLTGIAFLALPWLWWLGLTVRRLARSKDALRALAPFFIAVTFALPFYLRPWQATGNPFYPYYDHWFSRDAARQEMSRYHHALAAGNFGWRSPLALVTGPILLSLEERLYDGSLGWQFVLLLALGGCGLAAAVRNPPSSAAESQHRSRAAPRRARQGLLVFWPATVAVSLYLFWYLTAQQARFALPAALAFTLVAGAGWRHLQFESFRLWSHGEVPATRGQAVGISRGGVISRLVLSLLVVLSVASFPWRTLPYYLASWETLCHWWTWTEYVDDGTGGQYVPLLRALRERTPPNARLLLLFEHRGLYVPRAHLIGTPFFQPGGFTPPERFASREAVQELLQQHGVTHVVLTKSLVGPDRSPEWFDRLAPLFRGIEACVQQGGWQLLWESEDYVLFAVPSDAPAASEGQPGENTPR